MEENKLIFDFSFDETGKDQLRSISKWGAINAVLGFIGVGLNILQFVVAATSAYGSSGNSFMEFVQIAVAILLNITLYTAASQIKKGIDNMDAGMLTRGLGGLRNYYKIMGIVLIVVLVLALLAIVFLLGFRRN